jgi:hypothetical protein
VTESSLAATAERLPDGWGGDSPADDTLLRSYTEAWADLNACLGEAAGHATARTDELVMMDAHEPSPFSNVATLLRPVLDPSDPIIDEIARFYAPDDEGTPFLVWSPTPTPSFAARGWSLVGHPPLMVRAPGPADVPEPEGLEIVEVRDAEALAAFDRTMVEAFPVPEMAGRRLFADGVLGTPGWSMWLGVVDGEPIATAAAHVTDSIVGVEWISTVAAHRGRGIGEALTWKATLAQPELPAMLFASDLGQPVYRRMGYQNLARLTLWIGARTPA